MSITLFDTRGRVTLSPIKGFDRGVGGLDKKSPLGLGCGCPQGMLIKMHFTDRLLRGARHSLGFIPAFRPQRQAAKVGRRNALVKQALLELDEAMAQKDVERLTYLLGLLHLSYLFFNDAAKRKAHAKLLPVFKQIFELGQNDVELPTESSAPLTYFISYPRSGNTLTTRLTARATQGQVFEAMMAGLTPFSKRIYPQGYPVPRLIKDHVAHLHYATDRCVLLVRDGRDTVASLAYMTAQQGRHKFRDKSEIADFIRWLDTSYIFGGWAAHAKNMLQLSKAPEKLLVHYDDIVSKFETFEQVVDFFDPGNKLPREHLAKLFAERESITDRIRSKSKANREWGLGMTFEPSSMFYEWSHNRQGSSWREAWDSAAKKAFHETGATEFLIEFGFETDPDWWRH